MTNTIIRLRDEVLQRARKNQRIRQRLQIELNKSYPTVQRWFDKNSEILTTAQALSIISEELGLEQRELLNN